MSTLKAADVSVLEKWLSDMASRNQQSDGQHSTSAATAAGSSSSSSAWPQAAGSSSYRSPLDRAGLGSSLLRESGLPDALIQRIYLGLFVYSLGVYQLIAQATRHSPQAEPITVRLWSAYQYLLETAQPLVYEQAIDSLRAENAREDAQRSRTHEQQTLALETAMTDLTARIRQLTATATLLEERSGEDATALRGLRNTLLDERERYETVREQSIRLREEMEEWKGSYATTAAAVHTYRTDRLPDWARARKDAVREEAELKNALAQEQATVQRMTVTKSKTENERNREIHGTHCTARGHTHPTTIRADAQLRLLPFMYCPRSDCNELEQRIRSTEEETRAAHTLTDRLMRQLTEQTAAVTALETEAYAHEQAIGELNGPLATIQSAAGAGHVSWVEQKARERTKLNDALSASQADGHRLSGSVSGLQSAIHRLKEQKTALATGLATKLTAMNELKADVSSLTTRISALRDDALTRLSTALADRKRERDERAAAFEALSTEVTAISAVKRDALKAQADAEAERAFHAADLSSAAAAKTAVEQQITQRTADEQRFAVDAAKEVDALKARMSLLTGEIARAAAEESDARARDEALTAVAFGKSQRVSALEVEVRDAAERKDRAEAELQRLKDEMAGFARERDRNESDIRARVERKHAISRERNEWFERCEVQKALLKARHIEYDREASQLKQQIDVRSSSCTTPHRTLHCIALYTDLLLAPLCAATESGNVEGSAAARSRGASSLDFYERIAGETHSRIAAVRRAGRPARGRYAPARHRDDARDS
jgi:hypothetical protein